MSFYMCIYGFRLILEHFGAKIDKFRLNGGFLNFFFGENNPKFVLFFPCNRSKTLTPPKTKKLNQQQQTNIKTKKITILCIYLLSFCEFFFFLKNKYNAGMKGFAPSDAKAARTLPGRTCWVFVVRR
jgi:hypothetical protein